MGSELKTTMAETILVTGGAGFIGSHTIIVLADAGYKVVVFDNFHNSLLEAITRAKALSTAPDSIHFMEGNICCQDQMDAAFAAHPGISMVVHFAGLRFVGESKEQPWTYYHILQPGQGKASARMGTQVQPRRDVRQLMELAI